MEYLLNSIWTTSDHQVETEQINDCHQFSSCSTVLTHIEQ